MRTYTLVLILSIFYGPSLCQAQLLPRASISAERIATNVRNLAQDYSIEYGTKKRYYSTPSLTPIHNGKVEFERITSAQISLIYPSNEKQRVTRLDVFNRASQALESIDKFTDSKGERVTICIAKSIAPIPKPEHSVTVTGVALADGKSIVICLKNDLDGILRHELFHARMTQLKITPKPWIEEGMAEYVQYNSEVEKDYLSLIHNKGILPPANILADGYFEENFYHLRASSWAITYYLVKEKKTDLLEVPNHFESVDILETRKFFEQLESSEDSTK